MTGRARGAPLRLGPRGAGPWAPAPCPSAVEDAGLWGRWPGGRKPRGACRLVSRTGGAGRPRRRGTGGAGALPRAAGAAEVGLAPARAPGSWRSSPRRHGGLWAAGVRRDWLATRPSRRPAAAGPAARTFPAVRGRRGTRFSGPEEPAGAVGQGEVLRGPGRAGAGDEGPTPVGRVQGQGCVFLLRAVRGKKHAWLAR